MYPTRIWHKADLTTVLMSYVQHRFETEDFAAHPLLSKAVEATRAVQQCVTEMYSFDVWISPSKSRFTAEQGHRFLRRYSELARSSMDTNRMLFVLTPKAHALHHVFQLLLEESQKGVDSFNPLTVSVQQDEDFISRPSRLSRRVTAKPMAATRVVQRYLQACYSALLHVRTLSPRIFLKPRRSGGLGRIAAAASTNGHRSRRVRGLMAPPWGVMLENPGFPFFHTDPTNFTVLVSQGTYNLC